MTVALFLLCILFSCDEYNLVRTNPHDPKSNFYKPLLTTLTTTTATIITSNSATLGGNVTFDGGDNVTVRGVCWSTTANPTTASSKTTDGTGLGSFVSILTGLTANTKYYVRAYAINSTGTAYGNEQNFTTTSITVTDIDGNVYNTLTIGTQVWMKENLKTTKYRDGISIPLVTDATAWSNLSTPGYCWYNNDATNYKATYGAIYNWYTVTTGKLCPIGWHVPSDAEWTTLTTYLGGESVAAGKMKETGTTHWTSPNTGTTNESGFTALPGGHYNGAFYFIGNDGYWWSTTEYSATDAWNLHLYHNVNNVFRESSNKKIGFSVRCIKD